MKKSRISMWMEKTIKLIAVILGSCLLTLHPALAKASQNGSVAGNQKSEELVEKEQTAKEAEIREPAELYDEVLHSNPGDAKTPLKEKPKFPDTTYVKEYQYQDDIVFKGVFDTNSYYFEVNDYWKIGYAYAQIEFSLSQLIQGEDVPASLTFSLNHYPIYSCKINYNEGRNQTVYVKIPVEELREGFNSLDITGYVRIFDEDGCIDDMSGANWIHIKKSSFIAVGYEAKDDLQRISYYPYPFMSSMDEFGENCVVAVPENPGDWELSAAMMMRADLADETDEEDHIQFVTYPQMSLKQEDRVVFVSTLENLPEEYQKLLPQTMESLKDRVMVCSVRDSKGRSVLLIVSEKEEVLMEAVMMLLDKTRVSQERSSVAYVSEGDAQFVMNSRAASELSADTYTVESLVGNGIHFVGPFHRTYNIMLSNSAGFVLADVGKIVLNFRYSENLNFDRSLITVYWEDTPIVSKKLTKEKAAGDSLTFSMPKDVIGTTASKITVAFDLELEELYCTKRIDDMPWAFITKDSGFQLPVGESSILSFDLVPYPILKATAYNQVLVVLPDQPTPMEYDLLGKIAGLYSDGITSYGELRVIKASEFDASDADYHMIVLGTYQDNTILKDINDKLSFQYEKNGSKFASNEHQILSEDYSKRIGIMQYTRSPYDKSKSLLCVSAVDEDGLNQINQYLIERENRWELTKDAVLIDSDGKIASYTCLKTNTSKATPNLKKFIHENKDSLIFTLVSTSAMFLMLLMIILFLSKVHKASAEKRKKRK